MDCIPSTESIRLWTSISWTVKSITINRSAKVAVWHKDTKHTTHMHIAHLLSYYKFTCLFGCLSSCLKEEKKTALLIIPFVFGRSVESNSGAHTHTQHSIGRVFEFVSLEIVLFGKREFKCYAEKDRPPGYVEKSSNLSFLNRIGRTMQVDACAHLAQCAR